MERRPAADVGPVRDVSSRVVVPPLADPDAVVEPRRARRRPGREGADQMQGQAPLLLHAARDRRHVDRRLEESRHLFPLVPGDDSGVDLAHRDETHRSGCRPRRIFRDRPERGVPGLVHARAALDPLGALGETDQPSSEIGPGSISPKSKSVECVWIE
jgi:hypothetical protein